MGAPTAYRVKSPHAAARSGPADAFVAFGITGDLAARVTVPALYRLERRGLLECPVIGVGVEAWTAARLREHAGRHIAAAGETADPAALDRFAARLSYVGGDLGDPATFTRVAGALAGARTPVFHLDVPPSLLGTVVGGLARAGLTESARVVVRTPFGHDLRSARALDDVLHAQLAERQICRVDHVRGTLGLEELRYLRFANTMLEPIWNRHHVASVQITVAEAAGVEDRGAAYDLVGALRDVVAGHMLRIVAAVAMEPPAGAGAAAFSDAELAVLRSLADATPERCVRGRYEGYREVAGVAAGSGTETYAALRLEIDTWRWAGVPFLIRTGRQLPVTQTEARLVFRRPPSLHVAGGSQHRPEPDQLIIRLDPATGVRVQLAVRRAASGEPEAIALDSVLADDRDQAPTPYEVLLADALEGERGHFTPADSLLEAWRVLQPVLEAPPPVHEYPRGSWGPRQADALLAGIGRWHAPWVA